VTDEDEHFLFRNLEVSVSELEKLNLHLGVPGKRVQKIERALLCFCSASLMFARSLIRVDKDTAPLVYRT